MSRLLAGPPLTSTDTRVDFDVWSTTATLVVADPDALAAALAELDDELAGIDATCSRFRSDSEINQVLARPGRDVGLSPVLNAAMTAALRTAAATDYLVDPTVAAAVIAQGYDEDIAGVVARAMTDGAIGRRTPSGGGRPAPGAWRIRHDPETAVLWVPPGVGIDLGATAKALAADRAATRIASLTGSGVLVGLGGDIAVAGDAPEGGWLIAVAEDHRGSAQTHQTVAITGGGLATSSTTVRRWRTSTGWAHHIIDPRTGDNPAPQWRTASVAAASCVDANAAATAAIVLGADAPDWLVERRLPALLIGVDGGVRAFAGWPASEEAA
jgi:thiamine biosynthesis lipoprotein